MNALILDLNLFIDLTDEQFFELCQRHELIRFERNADKKLVLMPLFGGITSIRSANLCYQLGKWNRDYTLGVAFGSSTGFTLPNGAVRSPTASWLKREKWDALTPEQQEKFAPACPDFLVELRSSNDDWKRLQTKMSEYLNNGAKLGWLIDLETWEVEIYRPNQDVEILESPVALSGEDVLPGFVFSLEEMISVV
ncbi:Uma2 family endonuclease [Brasilonema sp. UFV-L1]|uniref:Uma2 family endonuclease n=1 Tax=Brasilonema sp. UFV-L1 TaxID=2234130 RepID=UPI00145DE8F1|nr:Uma2 family endonuclease [Brasilonema sp. UFV-L1]NMG05714.1 Uma2 family endonuclease [Brasilonema sp. UFV-L1]